MNAPADDRIFSLDLVRGVAVMGILAMNIVAFALPTPAYVNPAAHGMAGPADQISWAITFIIFDGKMRGLFTLLFGASALLVVERARAAGLDAARLYHLRMAWLLVFGLLHFFLIWDGDILFSYALCGLLLYGFRDKPVRSLVIWGVALITLQALLFVLIASLFADLAAQVARGGAGPETVRHYREMAAMVSAYPPDWLASDLASARQSWVGHVATRIVERWSHPVVITVEYLPETLGSMLLGMAAYRSGFLTGAWPAARYRRWLITGLVIGLPASVFFAFQIVQSDYAAQAIFSWALAAPPFVRPALVAAIVALIILACRKRGWLARRVAASGRMAFTNYLLTSLAMTTLFYGYGFGLYGELSRAQLWFPILGMWVLMLAWSPPWLARFRYGPFEWAWRSLTRGRLLALRKP